MKYVILNNIISTLFIVCINKKNKPELNPSKGKVNEFPPGTQREP
jgi:hypothetical protein